MTTLWDRAVSLEPAECMKLLSSARWGRVAFWGPLGPQVFPVNHTVLDGAIVFRTDLYSSLADGTQGRTVAFEADELDDRMQSGWSVLVVGRGEHIEDHAEMAKAFDRMDSRGRRVLARSSPGSSRPRSQGAGSNALSLKGRASGDGSDREGTTFASPLSRLILCEVRAEGAR